MDNDLKSPASATHMAPEITRLRQVIANMQGGILVEDENRHISLVNDTFCDMFHIPVPPQQLIGVDCSNSAEESKTLFVKPEAFVERITLILQNRKQVAGDILNLVDGRVFSRDYVPIYHEETYVGHLWHYHDITDDIKAKRRAERLLRLEEMNKEVIRLFLQIDSVDVVMDEVLAMTGHMLDVSRVYVFHFRENERLLDNTHEWCHHGVEPQIDNLKGLPFDDLVPSFFPLLVENGIIAPYHINELPVDVRGILEPQGIKSVLILPLYSDSRLEGFVGYDETRHPRKWLPEEITTVRIIASAYSRALERDRAQQMLIEARDEALRTAQLRAQFVANMSHEIRTPMTGTLGMLELLLETNLDEIQREFATEAFNSSSGLLTIINEILDFSKLDAGQIVLEAEPVEVRAIATEIKMTLLPQLKAKSVTLDTAIDSAIPHRVLADSTRLRQILMNLAGNAIKFTQHGQIDIVADVVALTNRTARLKFTIRDTGIGIAPDHIDHIFDSFVQADGSTTRKYGGTGLGLAISKQLVELMGGTLQVESELGEGSRFSFVLELPIVETESGSPDSSKFEEMRALVADPNQTTRYILAQQLENWGVTVTKTEDFRAFNEKGYDVIFLRPPMAAPPLTIPVVYVVDDMAAVKQDEAAYLQYPVSQSSLFNMLLAVQSASNDTLAAIPTDAHQNPPTQLGQILLAENNPVNVSLVLRALKPLNVAIDCVNNGQEVLNRLEVQDYDLILMDIHMPIMDGMEATRRIRRGDARYQDIPILAVTASMLVEEQDWYIEAGVNAIVGKPFSVKDLRQIVQKWLHDTTPNPDAD